MSEEARGTGGNTERYTPDQIIAALHANAGVRSLAAQALGCAPSTVTNYIDRYPEIADALVGIKEELLDLTEAKLIGLIREGSERSIHFYLRTQGKHRGYVERQEQTGPNGGPIRNQNQTAPAFDPSKLSTDELEALEALLSKAAVD